MAESSSSEPRYRLRVPPPWLPGPLSLGTQAMPLVEFPGALGYALCHTLRDLDAWLLARTDRRRARLFRPDAAARRREELAEACERSARAAAPLRTLAKVVEAPLLVEPEDLAEACEEIAVWAEDEGRPGTALAALQMAVRLQSSRRSEPRFALRMGRLLRRRGHSQPAEVWLNWAVMLARQAENREAQAQAYLALGILYRQRGALPRAEDRLLRGLRFSQRHHLHRLQGQSAHELFIACAEMHRGEEALRYAANACEVYRQWFRPHLLSLSQDIATFWIMDGQFARALKIFEAAWPHVEEERKLTLAGNLVRAAGAAGDEVALATYLPQAVRLLHARPVDEKRAAVLLSLARGLGSAGRWRRAETYADEALRVAAKFRNHQIEFEAEELLGRLRSRTRHDSPASERSAAEERTSDQITEALCTHFRALVGT